MSDKTERRIEWLNYHHLLYFWVVAREGGLVAAGRVLRLSHPTLSAQIHALENQLGEKLFTRSGRRLELTEMGRVVLRYADEIFSLGREMLDTVRGRSTGQPMRLDVGIADPVPKLVVRRLLEPALSLADPVRLACHEDSYGKLLADLALHSLDIVIADAPVPPGSSVRAFHHLLGETGVTFFGTAELARKFRRGFPKSLDGAPMLLPLENLSLRRALNQWFDRLDIKPAVTAEFEDSALLSVFGGDGVGIFQAPTVIEKEVTRQHGVEIIGRTQEVRERFYAISVERRLKHPAVVAISDAARHELFARS
ncbi:MAG TPA: transcriptional activator NhaR [Candidatus Limnocylindrales bacterium]|nr:transcriptional activator NhaR [Candidatus Limnocylindrales bacterium]